MVDGTYHVAHPSITVIRQLTALKDKGTET
jgi:hypothetical protein